MTINPLPSGIIPTTLNGSCIIPNDPNNTWVRPTSANPGLHVVPSGESMFRNATPANVQIGPRSYATINPSCSWCGSETGGMNLHLVTGEISATACPACLLKVFESVLGPRKTP